MEIVASKFERDGLIDYKEFVNSLKDKKPVSSYITNLSQPMMSFLCSMISNLKT